MGTRADFYAGKGKNAEWLGSIAWDGRDIADDIRAADNEEQYRKAVQTFLGSRDDATLPAQGWPWPWEDSGLTDCSYWFFDGKCWEAMGYPRRHYVPAGADAPSGETKLKKFVARYERIEFPDMTALQHVTLGPRSGILFVP